MGLKPTLCVINYNGERCLPATLGAAVDLADQFAEIILVDNGSADGGLAIVARDFPQVRVVPLPDNRGPGVARNAGIQAAQSERVLFIDNDVTLTAECSARLGQALDGDTNAVIAMPVVIYAGRRDTVQYAGAGSHFLGLMTLLRQNEPADEVTGEPVKVGSCVTCAFLVDRQRMGETAPFDEDFFYQMEDHDFGVRMRARGFAVLAVPDARVFHGLGTEGMSIRRHGTYAPVRVYCLIRNRWIFLLKTYSVRTLLVLFPMLLLYEVVQLIVVVRKGWLREWGRAAGWMIVNFPSIMAKRREVQRARRRPDRELFTGGAVPFRNELAQSPLERYGKRALDSIAATYWKGAEQLL
jgi:GT2 family glycosyltransferase